MSEDITFKLRADESGALNALKRLRSEVLNNEQGLKKLADEGKKTGKTLKDISGMAGGPLGQLGGQIDQITGSLKGVQGAGLAVKAGLVGVVAVAGFEIGRMLGDFIIQTKEWEEANKRAISALTEQASFLQKQSQDRLVQEIKIANLAETKEQRRIELMQLRRTLLEQQTQAELDMALAMQALTDARENNIFGFGGQDDAIAEEGLRIAKERVAQLRQQVALVEREQSGATGRAAELEARQAAAERRAQAEREAAKAIEDRMKAEAQAQVVAERLAQVQDDYLFSLEAEIVKLKEGEEAYTRLTLAKKEFSQETIDAAVAMQAEIRELAELKRLGERGTPDGRDQASRITAPGQVQATQQRFVTRGTGSKNEDKILALQQKQAKDVEMLAKAADRTANLLERRLPREVA